MGMICKTIGQSSSAFITQCGIDVGHQVQIGKTMFPKLGKFPCDPSAHVHFSNGANSSLPGAISGWENIIQERFKLSFPVCHGPHQPRAPHNWEF